VNSRKHAGREGGEATTRGGRGPMAVKEWEGRRRCVDDRD
jgi:hypothetical protein